MPDAVPMNLEAERCVLGALLLQNTHHSEVAEILAVDDFAIQAHQIIYRRFCEMLEEGRPADLVTICEELRSDGLLDKVGSATYIAGLTDGIPSIINVAHYAKIVHEYGQRRHIIRLADAMRAEAMSGADADGTIDRVITSLMPADREGGAGTISLAEMEQAWIDQVQAESHLSLGYDCLDKLLDLQPGELILICGAGSSGKTALVLNMIDHILQKAPGTRAAFYSTETSPGRAYGRLLALRQAQSQRHLAYLLRNGQLDSEVMRRFTEQHPNFRYRCSGSLTVGRIVADLRRQETVTWRAPAQLCVIDFLHALGAVQLATRDENAVTTGLAYGIQALAKSMRAGILIVLVHLTKLGAINKRVEIGDIRGSGQQYNVADRILGVWRPGAIDEPQQEKGDQDDTILVNILKNKDGEMMHAGLPFNWDRHTLRITERTTGYQF